MELKSFLSRLLPSNSCMVVATPAGNRGGPTYNKFFDTAAAAAGHILRQAKRGDVWFTPAGFKPGAQRRAGSNVQLVKALWADADISRPGDGKDPAKVFSSEIEVVQWVKGFIHNTGLPLPNVWIKSGYGLHLYWIYKTALSVEQWKPLAEALKAALVTHQFKGDAGLTSDAARVLRPPETFNYKVRSSPAACYVFEDARLTRPDYDNGIVTAVLIQQAPSPLGPKPAHLGPGTTRSGAAAATAAGAAIAAPAPSASLPPGDFKHVAANCGQVGKSLAEGGAGDTRDLWWRMITLASFCTDGREWAHKIGEKDPRYTPAGTDKEFDRAVDEQKQKNFGAPKCTSFHSDRPDICLACPHWGKLNSPITLRPPVQGNPNELPNDRYRRTHAGIEHFVTKNKKSFWQTVLEKDVRDPVVYRRHDNTYYMQFTFIAGDNFTCTVHVTGADLNNVGSARPALRVMPLQEYQLKEAMGLLMSWMQKLIQECRISYDAPLDPFGWTKDYKGFAVNGTCYMADGGEVDAPGSPLLDSATKDNYSPTGSFAKWKEAARFFTGGGAFPALEAITACSFAGPLIALTGQSGGCIVFRGPSGIGKTWASKTGASVWGQPAATMGHLKDTENVQQYNAAITRHLTRYWDDCNVHNDPRRLQNLVDFVFNQTEGRGKARLTADITPRPVGTWSTIFPLSTNENIYDMVAGKIGHNDATLLRILSIRLDHTLPPNWQSAMTYQPYIDSNYGHAGVIYARFIAQNVDTIQKLIKATRGVLEAKLAPCSTDERFLLAMATAVVVGARLAKHLSFVDFNIDGIIEVLCQAICHSRTVRGEHANPNPVVSARDALDQFMAAHWDRGVVQDIIKPGRPTGKGPELTGYNSREPLVFEKEISTRKLRISKIDWKIWCSEKGYSYSDLMEELLKNWGWRGAEQKQPWIGTGSPRPRRLYVFTLRMDRELEGYLEGPPAGSAMGPVQAAVANRKVVPIRPTSK